MRRRTLLVMLVLGALLASALPAVTLARNSADHAVSAKTKKCKKGYVKKHGKCVKLGGPAPAPNPPPSAPPSYDLVFDSTMVDVPTTGVPDESGSITYHVHSVVRLAGQAPGASSAPVLPGSAPLSWVSVSGQLNKAGNEVCAGPEHPVGPYSLMETATAPSGGTLQVVQASISPGGSGPTGLTLRIQVSPLPTVQYHSVFQGPCGDSYDRVDAVPTWSGRFFKGHSSEVPASDTCLTTIGPIICTYDISGWQAGPSGVYATKQYSQHLAYSRSCPGASCFFSDTDETTTLELRQVSK